MSEPAPAWDDDGVFRALFASYPDGLVVCDAGGAIVLANPAASELLGYAAHELVGRNVDVLVPEAIRPRHAAYRDAYGHAPRSRPMGTQMELVARRRDGTDVMVEIALSPLLRQGLPLVVAAIRGIGAYPRVKQALRRARYSEHLASFGRLAVDVREARALLPHVAATAVEALQVEAAILYLLEPDRAELRVAGVAGGGAAPGERIAADPARPPGSVVADGRPFRTGAGDVELAPAWRAAGYAGVVGVPVLDRGRAIGALVALARDPQAFGDDEQRLVESLANLLASSLQRARSEEALGHAQRLESVGQLTGGIAHDFNNLLTVIQGNLQVLEELPAVAEDDLAQQLVGAAARASRRGAELTAKLLAFSRRQVLQPAPVDVAQMLQSLADMLRRTVDQRIVIEVAIDAPCPPVLADPGQLESALLNIAINARDAMPDGGTLRFGAAACAALPAGLRSGAGDAGAASDRFVAVAIADTGVGMTAEVKERAFEPFFTTKEAGRGTGLGLASVYGFVSQSRGAVAIDSAAGAGTTVTLYLPQPGRAQPAAAAGDAATAAAPIPPGLRVLLVEDDAAVRAVARGFLEGLGCRVAEATSGEHALLALGDDAPFDLVLTDVALGAGIRGTRLAAGIGARFPALPVLLMSGYSEELLDLPAGAAGRELVRKPFSRADLARAVARAVAAR